MKITIDLDKLLEEGKITREEYNKFSQFAAHSTATLAFNILIGFGVIAVSGATLALSPIPLTAIALGLMIAAAGIAIVYAGSKQWSVLANMCMMVGALLFGGGLIKAAEGSASSFLLLALAFAGTGVFARSSLLIVLAVLALASCIGARTGYLHAMYFLGIQEPAGTVVLFTLLSLAMYQLSQRLTAEYEGLATTAARTSVVLVNFGFWIGSLWGDRKAGGEIVIADWVFSALWAIALVATGAWAWTSNRRWVVNVIAVFGAIHFYTQWFERLGASPQTVLIAGLLALGLALGLRALNASYSQEAR